MPLPPKLPPTSAVLLSPKIPDSRKWPALPPHRPAPLRLEDRSPRVALGSPSQRESFTGQMRIQDAIPVLWNAFRCRLKSPFTHLSAAPLGPRVSCAIRSFLFGGCPMARVLQFPKPLICSVCNKPVNLRIALTDHDGKAFHGDCYARMIRLRQITREKWRRFAGGQKIPFLRFELVMGSTRGAGGVGGVVPGGHRLSLRNDFR
jgi:hypothetical protein